MYRPCGTFDDTYSQTMAIIRTRRHWILTLLGLATLMTMPLYLSGRVLHFVNLLAINMIAAQGLNLLTGFAGQISLGQSAFMALGAFAAYNFTLRVPGMPILAAMALGGLPPPASACSSVCPRCASRASTRSDAAFR